MADYISISDVSASKFTSEPPKDVNNKYKITFLKYDGKKPLFKLSITNGKIIERQPGKLRLKIDLNDKYDEYEKDIHHICH